ncbi:hypothetical protein L3X38_022398 [Prunus dulcis]|uniref:Uncharacterized protein n=1 Tax=Prunus dulcis TaxID=3755 RepID=A0AAD4VXJ3_PRUDU|nr:hypothetical protein L3X38_022398 [Prunus dulcis]
MAMTKPHFQAEKEAIIEQKEGRHGYTIKPRGLTIVWGNDERYWKLPKNGSNEPVELLQVSWLEVTATVDLESGKDYAISFKVELAPDAFGWRDIQAFLMAKVGKKGKYKWTKVKLAQDSNVGRFTIPDTNGLPFTIKSAGTTDSDNTLHFGLYEVWSGKWKGGLKIYEANVEDVTGK